ncbi:MAG TPA: sodium:calcium antiporter [Spirochaetia bacterium]|nr:sodium:calcium antiporter [Spirochaetia bacterium]
MAETLRSIAVDQSLVVLIAVIAGSVYVLSLGADILVTRAVGISRYFHVSPVIIGATVVSLGTTAPEAAVSVLAAIEGDPGLALGNAVGSVISNTALIVGVAALIRPIVVDRSLLVRQGTIQYGSAILLVIVAMPFLGGARVPQWVGVVFVVLLAGYLLISVRWSRSAGREVASAELESELGDVMVPRTTAETVVALLMLGFGLALVIGSSQVLIPAVEATALRLGVPRAVIAASLVALGTSMPELVTAITASRKGHSDLALGNVIGANVLNVLFVVGASAAVTTGGLGVSADFYRFFFPSMLVAGALLYGSAIVGRMRIGRPVGAALIVIYLGFVVLGYAL